MYEKEATMTTTQTKAMKLPNETNSFMQTDFQKADGNKSNQQKGITLNAR
jgi:hypothetical protein